MSANFGNQGGQQFEAGTAPPPPVEPGQKSSSLLKTCLLLLGAFIGVAVLLAIGAGLFASKEAGPILSGFVEKGKPEIMGELSPDHSPKDRAAFEQTYDQMVKELKEQGIIKVFTMHEKSYQTFQTIIADKKITPDESKQWVREFNDEEAKGQGGKSN